jgi:hypothetical protein
MSIAGAAELQPLEIDPRPCEWCGLTIDQHRMVDDGEGLEFFCQDLSLNELTLPELERRAELIRQIEVAEIFARLEAMDDPSKRRLQPPAAAPPYRTPQSMVDAFFYVARLNDADYLKRWLKRHPRDAETLCKLWEGKNAVKA